MFWKYNRIRFFVGFPLGLACIAILSACATTTDPLGDQAVPTRMRVADLASVSALEDTLQAKQLFIRGMRFEMEGDYERAIESFTRALVLVPDEPAVLMALAEAHREHDDLDAARSYARKAHLAVPDDVTYHQQYAELLLHTGAAEQAIEVYADLVERHPQAYEAVYDLARLQTQAGRLREALETYEKLLSLLGEDMDVRTEMLHVYIRLADGDGIVSTLAAMVEAEPYNTSYMRMLAEAHAQNGDSDRAVELLQRAVDLDPDDFSLVVKLADLYRDRGENDAANALIARASEHNHSVESLLAQASAYYARAGLDEESGTTAEQLLHRILEIDPDNADAALMLGSIEYQNGLYAEAAMHFDLALEQHEEQVQLWFQAAAAHLQAGDAARSAETADEGLLLFPGQQDLLRVAAFAHMEEYQNDLALARFEELLRILREDNPDALEMHADVISSMAMIFDRRQDSAASDSLYAAAIAIHPDHSIALNNFAYALSERSVRLDEALEMAQRAVELEPDNPSFLDTLGWVYFQLGEYSEARVWIEKSVDAGSQSAAVFEHYGDVLVELGEPMEAEKQFRTALEFGGDANRLGRKIDTVTRP